MRYNANSQCLCLKSKVVTGCTNPEELNGWAFISQEVPGLLFSLGWDNFFWLSGFQLLALKYHQILVTGQGTNYFENNLLNCIEASISKSKPHSLLTQRVISHWSTLQGKRWISILSCFQIKTGHLLRRYALAKNKLLNSTDR